MLRTFSKIYGMAGLRCGFVVARPDLLEKVMDRSGWNFMPVTAVVAASASLKDPALVPERRRINASIRQQTFQWLDRNGYAYIPSESNCFLLDTKRPGKEVRDAMAKENVTDWSRLAGDAHLGPHHGGDAGRDGALPGRVPESHEELTGARAACPRVPRPTRHDYAVTLTPVLHSTHSRPSRLLLCANNNRAHGAQRLFRSYVERSSLFDRIAHVGVEAAIVAALGPYFARLFADATQSSPTFLRFHAPIRAPVKVRPGSWSLRRISSCGSMPYFTNDPSRPVKQQMRLGA